MATPIPQRTDIPQRYRWHAESVFEDQQVWETEYQTISRALTDDVLSIPGEVDSGVHFTSCWRQDSPG
jgi:hypothetical protein